MESTFDGQRGVASGWAAGELRRRGEISGQVRGRREVGRGWRLGRPEAGRGWRPQCRGRSGSEAAAAGGNRPCRSGAAAAAACCLGLGAGVWRERD